MALNTNISSNLLETYEKYRFLNCGDPILCFFPLCIVLIVRDAFIPSMSGLLLCRIPLENTLYGMAHMSYQRLFILILLTWQLTHDGCYFQWFMDFDCQTATPTHTFLVAKTRRCINWSLLKSALYFGWNIPSLQFSRYAVWCFCPGFILHPQAGGSRNVKLIGDTSCASGASS